MKFSNLKLQRGAVLAFSLLMLLLLTLAGTRMIQQNKQQLEMSNSARLLTQEFANAEGVLAGGYDALKQDNAHKDPTFSPARTYNPTSVPPPQCTPIPTLYRQQLLLAGKVLLNKTLADGSSSKAEIVETWCADTNGTPTEKCTSYNYNTGVVTCHPASGDVVCTGKTVAEVAAFFSSTDACYQHYDPNCDDDAYVGTGCSPKPAKCPVEVYNVRAISKSVNGTTREVTSMKQIKCDTP